jgi:hypothetical protein
VDRQDLYRLPANDRSALEEAPGRSREPIRTGCQDGLHGMRDGEIEVTRLLLRHRAGEFFQKERVATRSGQYLLLERWRDLPGVENAANDLPPVVWPKGGER